MRKHFLLPESDSFFARPDLGPAGGEGLPRLGEDPGLHQERGARPAPRQRPGQGHPPGQAQERGVPAPQTPLPHQDTLGQAPATADHYQKNYTDHWIDKTN